MELTQAQVSVLPLESSVAGASLRRGSCASAALWQGAASERRCWERPIPRSCGVAALLQRRLYLRFLPDQCRYLYDTINAHPPWTQESLVL